MRPVTVLPTARGPSLQTLRCGNDAPASVALARGECVLDAQGRAGVAWLVLRGRIDVEAAEGSFALGAREWIALDRDSAPQAQLRPGAAVLAVSVSAQRLMALRAERMHPVMFLGRGRLSPGQRLRAWRLWRALETEETARRPEVLLDGLLQLLHAAQDDLAGQVARCPGHSLTRKRQVFLRMQRARLCLEGHAGGALRVAELARRSNFSPWYFTKVFQALYAIGPLQLAGQLRLEHACRLLADTRLPVTEVSLACGFDNPCSFSRAFRARHGITASEYRLRSLPAPAAVRMPAIPAQGAWGLR